MKVKNADAMIKFAVNIDSNGAVQGIEELSKKSDNLSKKFTSAGKKLTLGLTAPLMAVTGKSLSLAGELEQNIGGTEAVFEKWSTNVQEISKTAYKNMGLSASDYMATMNKMGSLMQGSGLDVKTSMDLSSQAMQRAADVASVMGVDVDFAMESIAGAAKGNFTMMDNLGVAMNATTIEAYALSKGIDKSYDSMSNSEKVQLAMQMFLEKTSKYAGNYAKENDTLSGSITTLKAKFSDVSAELGTQLIPIATSVIEKVSGLVNWFSKLDDKGKKIVLTIAGIAAVAGPILIIFGKMIQAVTSIKNAFAGLKVISKVSGLIKGLGGVTASAMKGLGNFALQVGKSTIALGKMAIQSVLTTAKLVAQKVATAAMSVAQGILNAVMAMNPITLIIIAITALVAILVVLWNKCEGFREIVMSIINTIWGGIQSVMDFIVNIFNTVFNLIYSIVQNYVNFWVTIFTTIWNIVSTVFSNIWNFISTIFSSIWGVISGIANNIKNIFISVGNSIKSVFTGVKNALSTIFNGIVNVIKAPINGVINLLNGVIKGLNKIKIPKWVPGLGGKGINIPLIPKLATGTNYVAGEGLAYLHEGEAVVPKKYNPAIGGYGNNSQPIYVNVIADMDVNKFGKAFIRDIKTFSGGSKNTYNYGGSR